MHQLLDVGVNSRLQGRVLLPRILASLLGKARQKKQRTRLTPEAIFFLLASCFALSHSVKTLSLPGSKRAAW